jgi:hypothetical protein
MTPGRVLLLAVLLAVAACSKGRDDGAKASDKPPPMSEIEIKRAEDACKAYVDRVCACARAKPEKPELGERCQLKESKKSAIRMLLEVDKTDQATPAELFQIQDEIRKIVAKCIEEDSRLDGEGCPRLGAVPAAPVPAPVPAPEATPAPAAPTP